MSRLEGKVALITGGGVGIGGAGDARSSAKTADEAPLAPRLVIDGVVAFGGFGIMSSDARPEVVATA